MELGILIWQNDSYAHKSRIQRVRQGNLQPSFHQNLPPSVYRLNKWNVPWFVMGNAGWIWRSKIIFLKPGLTHPTPVLFGTKPSLHTHSTFPSLFTTHLVFRGHCTVAHWSRPRRYRYMPAIVLIIHNVVDRDSRASYASPTFAIRRTLTTCSYTYTIIYRYQKRHPSSKHTCRQKNCQCCGEFWNWIVAIGDNENKIMPYVSTLFNNNF